MVLGVHQGISLARRWLLGTHHVEVDPTRLASYHNESVFRFDRRHSRILGAVLSRVLELAVAHVPERYHDLSATRWPRNFLPLSQVEGGIPKVWHGFPQTVHAE